MPLPTTFQKHKNVTASIFLLYFKKVHFIFSKDWTRSNKQYHKLGKNIRFNCCKDNVPQRNEQQLLIDEIKGPPTHCISLWSLMSTCVRTNERESYGLAIVH